jgi:hypothetical protein
MSISCFLRFAAENGVSGSYNGPQAVALTAAKSYHSRP